MILARSTGLVHRSSPSGSGRNKWKSSPVDEQPILEPSLTSIASVTVQNGSGKDLKHADPSFSCGSDVRALHHRKAMVEAVTPAFQDFATADNGQDYSCMALKHVKNNDLLGVPSVELPTEMVTHNKTSLQTGLLDGSVMGGDESLGCVLSSGLSFQYEVSPPSHGPHVIPGSTTSVFIDTGQPSSPRPAFVFNSHLKPIVKGWKKLARSHNIDKAMVLVTGQKRNSRPVDDISLGIVTVVEDDFSTKNKKLKGVLWIPCASAVIVLQKLLCMFYSSVAISK
ncbi:hypothetical protein ACOSQ2_007077 [Xanthoceras sorbifolium]